MSIPYDQRYRDQILYYANTYRLTYIATYIQCRLDIQLNLLFKSTVEFYGRYNDLIYNYKHSLSHMLSDIFHTNSKTILDTLTLTCLLLLGT
jgi:hypothetical protein